MRLPCPFFPLAVSWYQGELKKNPLLALAESLPDKWAEQ